MLVTVKEFVLGSTATILNCAAKQQGCWWNTWDFLILCFRVTSTINISTETWDLSMSSHRALNRDSGRITPSVRREDLSISGPRVTSAVTMPIKSL